MACNPGPEVSPASVRSLKSKVDDQKTVTVSYLTDSILVYLVDPQKQDLRFFYKGENNKRLKNAKHLRQHLLKKNKQLLFAVNGGMYTKDHTPQGLYIENGKLIAPFDTQATGYGNFYLQPNGVFYVDNQGNPTIQTSQSFTLTPRIRYATQSGPMLLIDGKIHPAFREGSKNLNIRNGVGILADGRLIFAMSKEAINFYDFARFFKKAGCNYALYLDGFVSRTYLPAKKWEQLDGNFGVIIGVSE